MREKENERIFQTILPGRITAKGLYHLQQRGYFDFSKEVSTGIIFTNSLNMFKIDFHNCESEGHVIVTI